MAFLKQASGHCKRKNPVCFNITEKERERKRLKTSLRRARDFLFANSTSKAR